MTTTGRGRVSGRARLPRQLTIRVRLTLLFGTVVLVAGGLLLGLVLLLLSHVIETQPVLEGLDGSQLPTALDKGAVVRASDRIRADLRERTLFPLLEPSLAALAVFGAAGFVAGWFVAGRALAPVRTITAAAHAVAESGRLDTRIALAGPRDELTELADTFDAMLDRMERAMTAQRAFVGNASHELRTPVTISRTVLEVTLADPATDEQTRRLAEQLLSVTERQSRLIDGLLALARADGRVAEPRPVDLSQITRQVISRSGRDAASAQVRLTSRLPEAAWLRGDPVLLDGLVTNLVANALRYNETGGEAEVTVTGEDGGGVVTCTVVNSGPEVDQALIPRIFEPFRRGRERMATASGSGLGLSIVAAVARAHGGTATATANAGGGLTVSVRLPAI